MDIKKNYLINRNSALQTNSGVRSNYFAKKELMTFEKIARLSKIKKTLIGIKKYLTMGRRPIFKERLVEKVNI